MRAIWILLAVVLAASAVHLVSLHAVHASVCGDGVCSADENAFSCPADCGDHTGSGSHHNPVCGDGVCSAGETASSCPIDCGTCGDGICQASIGENVFTCPSDCAAPSGSVCGDGVCSAGENALSCPADCGDATNATAPAPVCGDGVCSAGENALSCPADCGTCGDGICEASIGENAFTCPADCGSTSVPSTNETNTTNQTQPPLPPPPLTASLSAHPVSGIAPLPVSYACSASGGTPPYAYSVSFDDGGSSSSASGSHTYAAGNYTMRCHVTDSNGKSASASAGISVAVDLHPQVSLSLPSTALVGTPVPYACTVISPGNPPLSSKSVSFGDGSSVSALVGTHVFAQPGDYRVRCTVKDADGDPASAEKYILITKPQPPQPPSVSFSVSPSSGTAPLSTTYSCSATGSGPFSYEVAFGDGSSSSSASGTHVYASAGNYTATCTAKDTNGLTGSATARVSVSTPVNLKPSVTLSAHPTSGTAPLGVNYSCSVSGGDRPLSSVIVDFGDGSESSSLAGSHVYENAGSYAMRCTVVDANGDQASSTVSIAVSTKPVNKIPTAHLTVSPTLGTAPLTVSYTCDAASGDVPYSIAIDFGDGSAQPAVSGEQVSGQHTYASPGSYPVTCTVRDANGDVATDSASVRVKAPQPVLTCEQAKSAGLLYATQSGGSVHIVDEANASYEVGIAAYEMYDNTLANQKLHDAVNGTVQAKGSLDLSVNVPMCAYQLDVYCDPAKNAVHGPYYNSSLIAGWVDASGGFCGEVPKVSFSVAPTSGIAPLVTNYSCSVTGGNQPVTTRVEFGDGTGSNVLSGSHRFADPGSYLARCVATDANGDVAKSSVRVTVLKNLPARAKLTLSPTSGFEPLPVSYACEATSGNEPFTYRLDLGDGTIVTRTGGYDAAPSGVHTYASAGTYPVTCSVTDANGDRDTAHGSVLVKPRGNLTSIDFSAVPSQGIEPLRTNVSCRAYPGSGTVSYAIDLGDGRTRTASDSYSELVTYAHYGVYSLTCTATDQLGHSRTARTHVTVLPNSPVAISPHAPYDRDNLSCSVTKYPSGLFDFVWTSDGAVVAHASNVSSAQLPASETSANDTIGCTASLPGSSVPIGTDTVVVRKNPYTGPANVSFDVSPNSGEAPLPVSWTCSAQGGVAPITYRVTVAGSNTSWTGQSGSATLASQATYAFTCTATDANGDSASASDSVIVSAPNYSSRWSISADPRSGAAPLAVTFDANTSRIPIVGLVRWDFADGIRAPGAPIVHVFPAPGTYDVTASATLLNGTVLRKDVVISVTPPGTPPSPNIDYGRVRITHVFGDIVGGVLYGTMTVQNDAGATIGGLTASVYLPELNAQDTQQIGPIENGHSETVPFFVPINGPTYDTYAAFTVSSDHVHLSQGTVVLG